MKQHHEKAPARSRRLFVTREGCCAALALLVAGPGGAQPSAEGAVSTLDGKIKTSMETLSLTTACAVSADDLLTGHDCAGALDCSTAQTCEFEGGLDHVAAGTGLRNRGSGTIELTGAPPDATAVGAWLYWGLIAEGTEGEPGDLATIVLEGHELTGEWVGEEASGPCWTTAEGDAPPFQVYRRPIPDLDLLHPGINGEYRVEVPSSSVTDGRDPWHGAPVPPPWIDGASLLVLYAHPDVKRGARFYLHHGAALLQGDVELIHELPGLDPVVAADSVLRHTRLGGDGQRQAGYLPTYPFTSWLEWDPAPDDPASCPQDSRLQIRGPGSDLDPVSDWKGGDGGSITQLWDTQVSEFLLPQDAAGCAGYRITYENFGAPPDGTGTGAGVELFYDCVVVVAHALTVR